MNIHFHLDLWDALALVGSALVLVGVGLYSLHLCLILVGVGLVGVGVWGSKPWRNDA